jgi:hypothetical protein
LAREGFLADGLGREHEGDVEQGHLAVAEQGEVDDRLAVPRRELEGDVPQDALDLAAHERQTGVCREGAGVHRAPLRRRARCHVRDRGVGSEGFADLLSQASDGVALALPVRGVQEAEQRVGGNGHVVGGVAAGRQVVDLDGAPVVSVHRRRPDRLAIVTDGEDVREILVDIAVLVQLRGEPEADRGNAVGALHAHVREVRRHGWLRLVTGELGEGEVRLQPQVAGGPGTRRLTARDVEVAGDDAPQTRLRAEHAGQRLKEGRLPGAVGSEEEGEPLEYQLDGVGSHRPESAQAQADELHVSPFRRGPRTRRSRWRPQR